MGIFPAAIFANIVNKTPKALLWLDCSSGCGKEGCPKSDGLLCCRVYLQVSSEPIFQLIEVSDIYKKAADRVNKCLADWIMEMCTKTFVFEDFDEH